MLPHQTTENLIKTGVFGISIPGTDLQKALLASGCCSGRVVGDKFAHLKLGKVAGQKLPLSFVEGALVHIECRVVEPELLKRTGLAIGEAVLHALKQTTGKTRASRVTDARRAQCIVLAKRPLRRAVRVKVGLNKAR